MREHPHRTWRCRSRAGPRQRDQERGQPDERELEKARNARLLGRRWRETEGGGRRDKSRGRPRERRKTENAHNAKGQTVGRGGEPRRPESDREGTARSLRHAHARTKKLNAAMHAAMVVHVMQYVMAVTEHNTTSNETGR